MLDRTGIKWSKEETILAFDLYCRTSFGKINSSNKDIIELKSSEGRGYRNFLTMGIRAGTLSVRVSRRWWNSAGWGKSAALW